MTVELNGIDFTTHDIEVLCDAALKVSRIDSDELGRWSLSEPYSKGLLQQEVEAILESGPSAETVQLSHKLLDALRLQRFNPNHDDKGRFAEGSGETNPILGRPVRGGRKEGVSSEARSRIRKQADKLAMEHPKAHENINYRIASGRMPAKTFGDKGSSTYAWCKSTGTDENGAGRSEIRMNPDYLKESSSGFRTAMDQNGKLDEVLGFHPAGTGTIEGCVTHETGHAYANYAIGSGISQREWLVSLGVENKDISAYAGTSTQEFIAESYASYKMNPGANELADRIGGALEKQVTNVEMGGDPFYLSLSGLTVRPPIGGGS